MSPIVAAARITTTRTIVPRWFSSHNTERYLSPHSQLHPGCHHHLATAASTRITGSRSGTEILEGAFPLPLLLVYEAARCRCAMREWTQSVGLQAKGPPHQIPHRKVVPTGSRQCDLSQC